MLCHDSMRPNWEKEDQEEGKELDGDDLVVLTEGWDDELEDHQVKLLELVGKTSEL